MTQLPLEVYRIDMKYIRNLHNIDDRIFSVSPQIGKDERPFLGIIIICNKHKYCVPLSKPKKKHEKMRDKIDFKKIVHNGTLIGVLNFNLMIPVENAQIQRIDTQIRKHDNMDTRKKKALLIKELEWCNEHVTDLQSNEVYEIFNIADEISTGKYNVSLNEKSIILYFPVSSIGTRVHFIFPLKIIKSQSGFVKKELNTAV